MTPTEFNRLTATTFDTLHALQAVKGGEYASDDDRLANFKEAGKRLSTLPEQVLLVYLDKHYASICNFVRDLAAHRTRPRSEPIEGRVDDMIIYLLLFKALLEERKEAAATLTQSTTILEWEDDDT
jgi:hypothetical protein